MRKLRATMVAFGGLVGAAAHAQEAVEVPPPDLDFLEYLGAWAEDDDEWLAIEEWQKGNGKRDGGEEGKKEEDGDVDDGGETNETE
jgi:hypothetical protein